MISFSKCPLMYFLMFLICDCVLVFPLLLITSEKNIVFNIIFSGIFLFSTYYISLLFKNGYEKVERCNKKRIRLLCVVLFIVVEIFSKMLRFCTFPIYVLSVMFYFTTIFISMFVLFFSYIAKINKKDYSKGIYKISLIILYFTTLCACFSLFKTPEQWIR